MSVLPNVLSGRASPTRRSTAVGGVGVREEHLTAEIGRERSELAFYNLGRFSTATGNYERIHFLSSPPDRFAIFANRLEHQAGEYYEESDADAGCARPDAVKIATVQQAKGMQWPTVWVPCMRHNRFPGKRQGGLGVFHVPPETAVNSSPRRPATPTSRPGRPPGPTSPR